MKPPIRVGEHVQFRNSPFLQRSLGRNAWVQKALANRTVFVVIGIMIHLDAQYLALKYLDTGESISGELSVELFERAE